ncbi:MAG: hypothetical protein HY653_02920 [Acidobacteria bacterium]|nr:hypothetical protein [Acidobacteriota bacterium]
MKVRGLVILLGASLLAFGVFSAYHPAQASRIEPPWQVHEAIVHSNLAIFPVTSSTFHDTRNYITLDEGLTAGTVKVTELGAALVRRRPGVRPRPLPDRARVNQLVLINDSDKALILLAGEIVTGGKQDRVIAKDRVIPPGADPLPLDVFCVEPGRWSGVSVAFGTKSLMAAPNLREKAQVAKSQDEVWASGRQAAESVADAAGVAGGVSSSSYAVMAEGELKRKIDSTAAALQQDYEKALRNQLRGKKVVGVVVAVNGEIIWADLFAEPALFEKYWPKLLRSYVVEALAVPRVEHARASRQDAEHFLTEQEGKQLIEVEPGEYRLVEVEHPRYAIFQLSSLLEKAEPLLHFNKLRKETVRPESIRPLHRPR